MQDDQERDPTRYGADRKREIDNNEIDNREEQHFATLHRFPSPQNRPQGLDERLILSRTLRLLALVFPTR